MNFMLKLLTKELFCTIIPIKEIILQSLHLSEGIMKESVEVKESVTEEKAPKQKSPVLEKIGNFFFGLFVTFLFTLPVWCILMIVTYFMNRL